MMGNKWTPTRIKLDEIDDFPGIDVQLNGIVSLYQRIGIANGATIVGNDERDAFSAQLRLPHFAQFILKCAKKQLI